MSYDSILKFIIDEYTKPILNWIYQTSIEEDITILKTELNVEPIRADGVFFLEMGQKIIHLEFQTNPQSDPPIPLRMLDYWVRLYRLYDQQKEIEQIVIFLKKSNSEIVFQDTFQTKTTSHRYRVIRIWEWDPQPLLEIPELLPLAVLAKSENPETLLATVAQKLDTIEDKHKRSNIAACVELLAGINFSEDLIAMYLQEDILKDSVVYQKLMNKGIEKGLQQGESLMMIRLLKKRFGSLNETLENRIINLSVEQLESLGESLFDFQSLDDVIIWLNQSKN